MTEDNMNNMNTSIPSVQMTVKVTPEEKSDVLLELIERLNETHDMIDELADNWSKLEHTSHDSGINAYPSNIIVMLKSLIDLTFSIRNSIVIELHNTFVKVDEAISKNDMNKLKESIENGDLNVK